MMTSYRAVCVACKQTTTAIADGAQAPKVATGSGHSTTGVYRTTNDQLALNCGKCGEPKHAVPAP